MILIINICKEKLHYFEFVKPIEDILKNNNIKFKTLHYNKLKKTRDCKKINYEKIIICGTSLKDNAYLKFDFSWIKKIDKPILGICAGMQIISLEFGGKIKNKTEIGYYKECFKEEFLTLKGEKQVYHLHNSYSTLPRNFKKFTSSKIPQAIKHNHKEIYGILSHPEVRNKEMIIKFLKKGTKFKNTN